MSGHIEDLLSAYIDDELAQNVRLEVEEHLDVCPRCRAILNDLREIQGQIFTAFQSVEVPNTIKDHVFEAIRFRASENHSKNSYWLLVPLLSAVFILAAVSVFAGTFIIKTASIAMKVILNLIYAFGSILGTYPYFMVGLFGFSLILIVVSSLSLKHLLKSKTI